MVDTLQLPSSPAAVRHHETTTNLPEPPSLIKSPLGRVTTRHGSPTLSSADALQLSAVSWRRQCLEVRHRGAHGQGEHQEGEVHQELCGQGNASRCHGHRGWNEG